MRMRDLPPEEETLTDVDDAPAAQRTPSAIPAHRWRKDPQEAQAHLETVREPALAARQRLLACDEAIHRAEVERRALADRTRKLELEAAGLEAALEVGDEADGDAERLAAIREELESNGSDADRRLQDKVAALELRAEEAAEQYRPLAAAHCAAIHNAAALEADSAGEELARAQAAYSQATARRDRALKDAQHLSAGREQGMYKNRRVSHARSHARKGEARYEN